MIVVVTKPSESREWALPYKCWKKGQREMPESANKAAGRKEKERKERAELTGSCVVLSAGGDECKCECQGAKRLR